MYRVAVRGSCRIAAAYEFRLTPLNKERHFVAHSLICACFELGNAPQRQYGINPDQELELPDQDLALQKLKIFGKVAFYQGKAILTTVLIIQIFLRIFTPEMNTWLAPHAATISACFWDMIMTSAIMERVTMIAVSDSDPPANDPPSSSLDDD